ncbi:protein containing gliding motility-associated C-terminal domain [Bacteroidales bacterium 6E]|nr:protein containing gliding motility-associated C-terminal domain [Bacteroidales bacterium 6E]
MNRRNKGLPDNNSCYPKPGMKQTSVWARFILTVLFISILTPSFANKADTHTYSLIVENDILCQNDTLRIRFADALPADITDSIHFVHGIDTISFLLANDQKIFSPPDSLRGISFPTNLLNLSGNYKVFARFIQFGETEYTVLADDFELVKDVVINENPLDVYVCQGDPVIFNVSAENYTKITWQYKPVNTNIWISDLSQSGDKYHVIAEKLSNDTMSFRAFIVNKAVCSKLFSKEAILWIDTIKPEVKCPENIYINIDPGICDYPGFRLPSPISIKDTCATNQLVLSRSDGLTKDDPYPIGTTTIQYKVMDKSRNTGECTFDIVIENNDYKKIDCKEKETLYLDEFCRAKINDRPLKILPPCVKDSIGINYAGIMNYTKAGNWTVRYFAYHERILECTTEITVLDTIKKLTFVPDKLVTKDADPGKCTAVVPQKVPVIKSCTPGRDKIELISEWPVNDEFPVGETTNQWQITWFDGTKDTLDQKIVVHDVSIPIVNCPEDTLEIMLDPGICSEWIDLPELSKGFACGPVEVKNSRNNTENASGNFQAGFTDFKWTVTHQGNVIKECPQHVLLLSKPEATDDRITIKEDEIGLISILNNDNDCGGIQNVDIEVSTIWLPTNGTAFLNSLSQIEYTSDQGYSGTDTIGYRIINEMGQADSALVIITIEANPDDPDDPGPGPCAFLIPDGFSPNGDGIGERFYIRCIEEYPNARISVFNRYGQLLFEQEKYGNVEFWGSEDAFWNGKPNRGISPFQSILPAGTYFYLFDPGDGQKPVTGSIYLNTNIKGMNSHE